MSTLVPQTQMTWPRDAAVHTPDGPGRVMYEFVGEDGEREVRVRLSQTGESRLFSRDALLRKQQAPRRPFLRVVGGTDLAARQHATRDTGA